jgi:hypothetical protein
MRAAKDQPNPKKVNAGNASMADLFFDSPSEECSSYSSKDDMKLVQNYQGNKHLVHSSYAVKYLPFMILLYRIMEEGKREAIIRTDTEYDREAWDDAIDSYRLGQVVVPWMDGATATLCECYKMDNMPILLDEDKFDKACLCQWRPRDSLWLLITDFHEAPHGLQDNISGTDRATRLYLVGCVKGYLTFLKVMFFSRADTLLARLITWLERPDSPFEKPANAEFVKCRIDSMIVDFWSEVRSNARVSKRFPSVCDFQNEGAVWILLSRYEQALFEQMAMDEYPHIRFYEKPRGEYWRIRGGGKSVNPGASLPRIGGQSSQHTATQKPMPSTHSNQPHNLPRASICPYHLAWKMQVKRNDGSHMAACQYENNCRLPHVELDTITSTQATGALSNCKPSMVTKVSNAITAKVSDFKA